MFYIDDGNVKSKPASTLEIIKYIKNNGKYYGYQLNMNKGSLCMAKFSNNDLAKQHYNALISEGLKSDIIHFHPDNLSIEEQYNGKSNYGMKVLGVHIGDEVYINNKMENYVIDLKEKSDNLINFNNNQDKYLLLYYCYVPLIDHYLKTTSPTLTVQLCQQFENLKKSILLSCLNHKVIDNNRWTQARLPINKAGLGLRFSHTVRETAFVASVIKSYAIMKKFLPQINYLDDTDEFFKSFRTAVNNIILCQNKEIDNNNNNNDNNNNNNKDNNNNKISLENIMELKSSKTYTLQAKLTDIINDNKYIKFINSISDTKYLSLLTSLYDNSCGKWLETIPKNEDLIFTNGQYTVNLCYRLFLDQPYYVPNSVCNCNNKPSLDKKGLHLSCCSKNGTSIKIHDAFVNETTKIIKSAGGSARTEVTDCLQSLTNNSRQRTDVNYKDPPTSLYSNSLLLDMCITTVFEGVKSGQLVDISRKNALIPFRKGSLSYNFKNNKHKQLANDNGYDFLPSVMESPSGRLDQNFKNLLKEIAKKNSEQSSNIKESILYNYYLKRISCVFQKNLSSSFLSRTGQVNGKLNIGAPNNYIYKYSFISDFHKFN
jgi:hypothetical protein